MQRIVGTLLLVAWSVCFPSLAWAQATIAGAVRDISGGVLPGVTVEAASPALIEKLRTAVTDGSGRYRIEELRPGTYTVTFSLPGFASLKREGLLVSGAAVINVEAELRVGGVQETVTVTGETPVVDAQSTKREITLDNETIRSIPSVRSYSSLLITVPGVQTDRNNVPTGPLIAIFPIHGGRIVESRLRIDGLNVGNPPGGDNPGHYVADVGNAQEVTFVTSGGLGESETGGLIMNLVPKTGGNAVSGQVFFSGFSQGMQADNFDDALKAQGVLAPTPLKKVYDFNAAVGGPIVKDRLWYFGSGRTQGQNQDIVNLFYNKNAGDPTKWTYEADLTRPAYSDRTWENVNGRLTFQATPRNKFTVFWDEQWICRKCTGTTWYSGSPDPTRSPESDGTASFYPQRVQQARWTSPATSRLLLEAGFGTSYFQWGNRERPGNPTHDLERVFNIGPTVVAPGIVINNMWYRSQDWLLALADSVNWTAAASFVTGGHSLKFGYQGNLWSDDRSIYGNSTNLTYLFLFGSPLQILENINPFIVDSRAMQTSFYAQEQWTVGRLTLQGALRYDHPWSWFPATDLPPQRFLPNGLHFDRQDGVTGYNDVTPRMGAAYDVFGNGKTALKVNLGKYLQGASSSNLAYDANPMLRVPFGGIFGNGFGIFNPGVARSWSDTNFNFKPDCDLQNPLANGECGQIDNLAFGTNQIVGARFDPDLLHGSGIRPSDWAFGLSIQQEIVPRASIEVAYNRRWFNGFTTGGSVTDNLQVGPDAFDSFCTTAPQDPQLPNGGGQKICGLMNLKPQYFGLVNQLITPTGKLGDDTRVFNGVDVTLNVRMHNGLTFQGGTSAGKTVDDYCEIRAKVPEATFGFGSAASPLNPYCHRETPWLTQFRGLASYTIPKIGALVSAVYQDKPGQPFIDASLAANYSLGAKEQAEAAAQIGRSLTPQAGGFTVNLVQPGTLYGNRIREFDFGAKKILRFGRTRTTVGVDIFNVFNSSVALNYNTAYAGPGLPGWLTPTEIMTARVARFNAEFSW